MLNSDTLFIGSIPHAEYAYIISCCLENGPACTSALLHELSLVSLLKFHSTFDNGETVDFWSFVSSIFDNLHRQNQVSRDDPPSTLGILTNACRILRKYILISFPTLRRSAFMVSKWLNQIYI